MYCTVHKGRLSPPSLIDGGITKQISGFAVVVCCVFALLWISILQLSNYFGRFKAPNTTPARKSIIYYPLSPDSPPHMTCTSLLTALTISFALHLRLEHLEGRNTHVRMLFLEFCSVFNTIILQHLVSKLPPLGYSTPLCKRLLDLLTNRLQSVRVGKQHLVVHHDDLQPHHEVCI